MERFLPLWIAAGMAVGLVLGRLVSGLNDALDAVKVGQTSLPIALGLLLVMYPVLAKVRYREAGLRETYLAQQRAGLTPEEAAQRAVAGVGDPAGILAASPARRTARALLIT